MTRRNNWLDKHTTTTEGLCTANDHHLDPPQVAEQMRKLHSSVYARRRYENKVKTDPALLGGRRRLIVCWGTAAVGGLEVLY